MTKELDNRLRQFIADPADFLAIVAFVGSLHQAPVWAAESPYAIEIDGQKVTPVFTDKEDLAHFVDNQTSAGQQTWVERMTLEVLEEVIGNQLLGLVFNVKKVGDKSNTTLFQSAELIQFINYYTQLLNDVMGDANIAAPIKEKSYLVPAFLHPNEDGTTDRFFPTMSTPDGESYAPVFSSLPNLAKWYRHDAFGKKFKEAGGVILAWKLSDFVSPENGENEISDSLGVVIDAFEEQQVLIKWEAIK